MPRLLFDASSLIYALKLRRLDILPGNYIQWLTVYEALNALWKEAHLVKTMTEEKARKLAEIVSEITGMMRVLGPHPYEAEMLAVARELGVTVYDASYIVLASRHGLTLVTEDRRLRSAAGGLVEALSLDDVVG